MFSIRNCNSFSPLGFIIQIWADGCEKLLLLLSLVSTPPVFLGGSFYSVEMLPRAWQTVTPVNCTDDLYFYSRVS